MNWIQVNNGLQSIHISSLLYINTGYLFAGTSDGVFRSSNNGLTWVERNVGLPTSTNVEELAISPNGDIVLGSWGGVYISSDNGDNWLQLPFTHWIYSMVVDGDGRIFAGASSFLDGDKIYRSDDNGNSWFEINNGLIDLHINKLAINSSSQIFAGTTSGIFYSIDNADTWTDISGILSSTIFDIKINLADVIFVADFDGIYRSSDHGTSWTHINNNYAMRCLAISSDQHIFAGGANGVYCSTNSGNDWTQLNNLYTILIAINSDGDIFICTAFQGMLRSMDNGQTWLEINQGITTAEIYSIDINHSDDIFIGTANKIYRSIDNGNNWVQTNQGLPTAQVFALEINSSNIIYAAINNYVVFRSTDNGESWDNLSGGLTSRSPKCFAINPDNFIFVGTTDFGVYRSKISTTSVGDCNLFAVEEFILFQNYPNPFNPATIIRYELPKRSFMSIKVYDLLGREVATLVNEEKSAGEYEVEFDASALTSGIYFYQLKAGDFGQTKKMILLK